MPFSDDYTESEESSEEESADSEPHSSDIDFIDDDSLSSESGSESEVEITEEETMIRDDEAELILENIVNGMVEIPQDENAPPEDATAPLQNETPIPPQDAAPPQPDTDMTETTPQIDTEQIENQLKKLQEERPIENTEDEEKSSEGDPSTPEEDVEITPIAQPQKRRRTTRTTQRSSLRNDPLFRDALLKLMYRK